MEASYWIKMSMVRFLSLSGERRLLNLTNGQLMSLRFLNSSSYR